MLSIGTASVVRVCGHHRNTNAPLLPSRRAVSGKGAPSTARVTRTAAPEQITEAVA